MKGVFLCWKDQIPFDVEALTIYTEGFAHIQSVKHALIIKNIQHFLFFLYGRSSSPFFQIDLNEVNTGRLRLVEVNQNGKFVGGGQVQPSVPLD